MNKNSNLCEYGRIIVVNLFLAFIIVGLFVCLTDPALHQSVNASGFPVYCGYDERCVALECAVTWDASALPDILDVLKQHDIRITFAVSGMWAENNPDLLREMKSLGHEIATLGYAPDEDGTVDFVENDVAKSCDVIYNETGSIPSLYCLGSRNTAVSTVAASKCDLIPVKCTLDILCANGDCNDIIERICANTNVGNILLVTPTNAFLNALPDILLFFENKGLTVSTVSSIICS